MDSTLAVARKYVDAVAGLFAEDIVWHQPGANRLSGVHRGSAAVDQLLGAMMTISGGSFELSVIGVPMVNADQVAIPVHFAGQRAGGELGQDGVDVLRIEGDRIAEVRLFSSDQEAEDAFWGV
ncbi:nuclear transport factor 2 family protein [Kribbella sp. NPDC049174]|uniref:nuclear transport factor 2 family protein n=1 Tax=Kribbella sp. NPDC049174 TaxID=3364112 RepID=UPI0037219860